MARDDTPEQVLFEGRPTALLLLGSFFWNLLFGGAAAAGLFLYQDRVLAQLRAWLPAETPAEVTENLPQGLRIFLWVVIALAAWNLIVGTARHLTTHYRLTTRRLQHAWGVFNRETDNLELARMVDLQLQQPLLLRMFGYGNLILVSSDKTSPIKRLRGVPQADRLMAAVAEAIRPAVIHEIR